MVTVRSVDFRPPRNADEWTPTPAIVEEMVRRLAERFDPQRIILFGSLARDEARRHSDVDLLMVFDRAVDKAEVMTDALLELIGVGAAPEVLVTTVERYETGVGSDAWTLYRDIDEEGIVVYERANAAGTNVARLRAS